MNSAKGHRSKLLRVAVWALCAVPFVVVAEQVRTPTSGPRPGESGVFERSGAKAEAERLKALHAPISEEDWKQAEKFLDEHSKNRLRVFRNLPHGEHHETLKRFLVGRWRGIAALKDNSPELYKVKVREVELDDEIFGICLKLKHGHEDKQGLHTKLKAALDELFVVGLQERKQRIGLVEKSLVVQKKALETDDRNKVQIVAERYQHVLDHGVEGARFDKKAGKGKNGSSPSTSPGDSEVESFPDAPATRP